MEAHLQMFIGKLFQMVGMAATK